MQHSWSCWQLLEFWLIESSTVSGYFAEFSKGCLGHDLSCLFLATKNTKMQAVPQHALAEALRFKSVWVLFPSRVIRASKPKKTKHKHSKHWFLFAQSAVEVFGVIQKSGALKLLAKTLTWSDLGVLSTLHNPSNNISAAACGSAPGGHPPRCPWPWGCFHQSDRPERKQEPLCHGQNLVYGAWSSIPKLKSW